MHKLLARQLRRAGIDEAELPAKWRELLRLVDDAYREADKERALMERSLELTSHELLERNVALRSDLDTRRRGEEELRRIIETLPHAVLLRRGPTLVYVNPAAVRMLKYESAAEIVGRPMLDIFAPAERTLLSERMASFDASGQGAAGSDPPTDVEYRLVAKDGSQVVVERGLVSNVALDGSPAVLTVLTDITHRRQLESRVQVADRMASLGTMAAGIAHEINNPLTYVQANIEFSAESLGDARAGQPLDPAELESALADAASGVRRVQRIVASLKTFSRVDEEARCALSINQVIESAIELSFNQIKHKATLVRRLARTPRVFANEGRLVQVFVNLLVNAAQALPAGDGNHRIVVETRATEGGHVVVEVSDTGTGIPPEVLPRIFEPFFTTKGRDLGTGLGLSICHGIVQALGGTLEVETEIGRGSLFRVTLPRGEAKRDLSAPPPKFDSVPGSRILVVDDEAAIGTAVARVLHDHEVVTVLDAPAALSALRQGKRFDVVLCDLMMPGANGDELFAAVRERDAELASRFVFMTGGTFTPQTTQFLERVQHPRLMKPFSATDLRRAIGSVVGARAPKPSALNGAPRGASPSIPVADGDL